MGADTGKIGLLRKSMYGTRDAASKRERVWQTLNPKVALRPSGVLFVE